MSTFIITRTKIAVISTKLASTTFIQQISVLILDSNFVSADIISIDQ